GGGPAKRRLLGDERRGAVCTRAFRRLVTVLPDGVVAGRRTTAAHFGRPPRRRALAGRPARRRDPRLARGARRRSPTRTGLPGDGRAPPREDRRRRRPSNADSRPPPRR